jgi:hypothetical protein
MSFIIPLVMTPTEVETDYLLGLKGLTIDYLLLPKLLRVDVYPMASVSTSLGVVFIVI